MPRPLRPLVAGGTYHVYSRSRPDYDLFGGDLERQMFLSVAARRMKDREWSLMGFCLMPNHFHLLVRTPADDLADGMRDVLGEYVRRLHARESTKGPVMRGRYGARLLADELGVLQVLRYIALNPVKHGFVDQPSRWAWSSHRAFAGEAPAPPFLDVAGLRAMVQHVVGDLDPAAYRRLLSGAPECPEVRSFPPSPALGLEPGLLELVGGGSGHEIARAHREYGHSLRSIAAALGCSHRTVARRLRDAAA